MAKKVRKKTKAELADPAFRERAATQGDVLVQSLAECDRLSKTRHQFVLDVAAYNWMHRFPDVDDDVAFRRESRTWAKKRREFITDVEKPLEIHCFTCNYNADAGLKPLVKLVKNHACDAGTALRLFWINDPVYYSQYETISECPNPEEQDGMRLLRAIRQRFKRRDFKSSKIYFDPTPWLHDDDVDLEVLDLPEPMLSPIP